MEKQLAREPAAPAAMTQFSEGLKSLGDELGRAIATAQTGAMARKVDGLAQELEALRGALASLDQLAAQRLDHLRHAQERLLAQGNEGATTIVPDEAMLAKERAFLAQFAGALAKPSPPPNPSP
jgi:IS4 transposase